MVSISSEVNTSDLQPPDCKEMTKLDRNKFDLTVSCRAIKIPSKMCTEITKKLKGGCTKFSHLQHKPRMIIPCENDTSQKYVLLDEDQEIPDSKGCSETLVDVKLTYKHWSATQILRAILPNSICDTDIISGFEIIGHIAHLNLKECHKAYKNVIGQVILDKNPSLKTAVNKLHNINAKFRYFEMEVLAGEDNLLTTAIEHKFKYQMDFSKVYWNSRLSNEHQRVVDSIPQRSVVMDMFCGIGPFAIPLAKKQCYVHANDLNPESFKYLEKNIKINKISKEFIKTYNMDGRNFIIDFNKQMDFVLMNLPASATDFLDVFRGLYALRNSGFKPPTVFCYHFANIDAPLKHSIEAVSEILRCPISPEEVHLVRKTSPNVWMTCVKFVVPTSVLYNESENKRFKADNS